MIPSKRQGHASVIISDSLIIFGGSNDSGLLNDIWMFDLSTYKWSPISTFGDYVIPRTNHRAAVLPNSNILANT